MEKPMDEKILESSDSVRSAQPLRYVQTVTLDSALKLELGGELPSVAVAYETYGQLNAARDNAVLVCHAISGDSHVAKHNDEDDPGWWDVAVGPGKPIDTNRYFVVVLCDMRVAADGVANEHRVVSRGIQLAIRFVGHRHARQLAAQFEFQRTV